MKEDQIMTLQRMIGVCAVLACLLTPEMVPAGQIPVFGIQMNADATTGATKIRKRYGSGILGDDTVVIVFAADGDRAFVDIPFSPYATSAATNSVDFYFTSDETDPTKRPCLRVTACVLPNDDDIDNTTNDCPAMDTSTGTTNTCTNTGTSSPITSTCFIRNPVLLTAPDSSWHHVRSTLAQLRVAYGDQLCAIGSPPNCANTTIRLAVEDDRASNANCTTEPLYLNRLNFNYPQ
jgi:hypothetical protein